MCEDGQSCSNRNSLRGLGGENGAMIQCRPLALPSASGFCFRPAGPADLHPSARQGRSLPLSRHQSTEPPPVNCIMSPSASYDHQASAILPIIPPSIASPVKACGRAPPRRDDCSRVSMPFIPTACGRPCRPSGKSRNQGQAHEDAPDRTYSAAQAHLWIGQPDSAVILFRELVGESPGTIDDHGYLGIAHAGAGGSRERKTSRPG